jgi:hypothetical protein
MDPRVGYGLELPSGGRVGKDDRAEGRAVQSAFLIEDVCAEELLYLCERGLAGFDNGASDAVGVNDRDTAVANQVLNG